MTQLRDAVWQLEEGYCLWVGAGVTRTVAAGHADVPLWDEVTAEMETAARIATSPGDDFPTRLERCLQALGEGAFRSRLRERYYTDLSEGILSQALECAASNEFVPEHVRALAALGQLANPIVSFNIEPFSSLLLGRPAGPVRILFQQHRGKPGHAWREAGGRFQRIVYHPHGLATGDSVMTASQYEANRASLAFSLAIHSAFGNTLVIVGMSLDDNYLREQIEVSRRSLGDVYWFDSRFPEELASWAARNEIRTVQVDWGEFWKHWRELPVELERSELSAAWYLAVDEATDEAEGGSLGSLERSLSGLTNVPDALAALAQTMADDARAAGEPGHPRMIRGESPRAIELALRQRLIEAGIPIPAIQKHA